MAEPSLSFEELALVDQVSGHVVAEPVEGRGLDARGFPEPADPVGQGTDVEVVGTGRVSGEQPVPSARPGPTFVPLVDVVVIIWTVVRPRVRRRVRLDFVEPITPSDNPRRMVRTRPSRSPRRRRPSSPRRAAGSAAKRTRMSVCSAANRSPWSGPTALPSATGGSPLGHRRRSR